MPEVTLAIVARRAGVHRSTVSLALRNNARIPEETRRRIRQIAEELGYRPNPLVTALMQLRRSARPARQTANLAYLTAFPTRFGWRVHPPDFYPGAVARAAELGYSISDFWLREPRMTPTRLAGILTSRGIHGIVLARPPPGTTRIEFPWNEFVSVSLGLALDAPLTHRVAHNHFYDVQLAFDRCRALGYRRVGLAVLHLRYPRAQQIWIGGFLARLRGLPASEQVQQLVLEDEEPGPLTAWIRRERVDAVLTGETVPALRELAASGVAIPRDLGFAALNLFAANSKVAGVLHDPDFTGAAAVNLVASQLYHNEQGLPAVPTEVLLNGQWQDGRSLPPARSNRGRRG
jgi:LacI family transcriptional regulator